MFDSLPEKTQANLTGRGITQPTPIQEKSLPHSLAGRDVLGRARTGTGKTLAFVLPIAARLAPSNVKGRSPRALVLAPTRELAKQIGEECNQSAGFLSSVLIYGGASYEPQEKALHRGVDIVVGTPGRIIDHLERNNLDLSEIEMVVLDEADEMLSLGFADAIEEILRSVPKDRQTMFFSATVPPWLKKLAARELTDPAIVDLVGEDAAVTSTTEHVAMTVRPNARLRVLADLLAVYAPERAIVFTRTKKEVDELAIELSQKFAAEAIHGDLSQTQRERALSSFRSGRAKLLVATDVAARGLDIPEVDLVVQYHLPYEAESYIHRAGRTGRAGRAGRAIVFYTDRETRSFRLLEQATGVHFKRLNPPTPNEIRLASINLIKRKLEEVPQDSIEYFQEVAEELMSRVPDAMAAALALLIGYEKAKPVSLITGEEGMTTIFLRGQKLSIPKVVAVLASQGIDTQKIGRIKEARGGFVADLPAEMVENVLAKSPLEDRIEVEIAQEFEEKVKEQRFSDKKSFNRGDRNRRRSDRPRFHR